MASYAAAIDSLFPAPKGRRARRRAGIKNSKNNKNKKANRKSNKASSSTSSGNGAAVAKADAPTTARKVKLRPAEDVLSRIRHDPDLDEEEFLICYEDRFLTELQEMTLAAWDEGLDECVGGIPLHRVRQFKHFDTVVWDRTSRLDLIFHSGNSAAAAAAASAVTLAASASEAA